MNTFEPRPAKMKTIRYWNTADPTGRSKYHLAVGAFSKAHAMRLLTEAIRKIERNAFVFTPSNFKHSCSECWGKAMWGIEPSIGVWKEQPRFGGKVVKVL